MVVLGCGLGDQHRQEWHAGHHGSVHVVVDKPEVLRQETADQRAFGIGDIQFHLGVDIAVVPWALLRIVPRLGLIDLPEDGTDVAVVRLHDGCRQLVHNRFEREVYLVETMTVDLGYLLLVAQNGC